MVKLVSAVGKSVTSARHVLTRKYGTPSSQPSPELDDEELLLKLPLLRLGTDVATTIEVGGDIVRSAVGAPGMLPKAPHARASSNSANTAIKRPKPQPPTQFAFFLKKNSKMLRVGVRVRFLEHSIVALTASLVSSLRRRAAVSKAES